MNKVEEAIRNYIKSDDILAFQLDGSWGTGKTFFVKSLIGKLRTEKIQGIHFSIYGYDSLQEIKTGLVDKIISETSVEGKIIKYYKKNRKSIKAVSQVIGDTRLKSVGTVLDIISDNINDKTLTYTDNIVIFIDDLERLSSKINLDDFLGFISSELLERKNYKVILVSNSDKIEGDKYKIIREKTIGTSIKFELDYDIISEIIFSKLSDKYLLEDKEWLFQIVDLFLGSHSINLRTLFLIISNYNFIENKILGSPRGYYDLSEEELLNMCKSVFLNILVVTQENRLGKLKNIEELITLVGTRDFASIEFEHISSGKYSYDDENITISDAIYEKYHRKHNIFNNYILYSSEISSFVLQGHYARFNYIEFWKRSFRPTKGDNLSRMENLQYNFRNLRDEEAQKIQEEIYENISLVPELEELLRIYVGFAQFNKMGLLFLEDNWRENFNLVLYSFWEKEVEFPEVENQMIFSMARDSVTKEDFDWVIEKYQVFEKGNKAQKWQAAMSSIFDGTLTQEQRALLQNWERKANTTVISEISNNLSFIDHFILKDSSEADKLLYYLKSDLIFSSKAEESEIEKIISKIEQGKPKITGRIDNFKIQQLLDFLNELKEKETI
jgi:hypothetical protein